MLRKVVRGSEATQRQCSEAIGEGCFNQLRWLPLPLTEMPPLLPSHPSFPPSLLPLYSSRKCIKSSQIPSSPRYPITHPSPQMALNNSMCVSLRLFYYAYDNTHVSSHVSTHVFCCIALFYFVQWDQCTHCSVPFFLLKNMQYTDSSVSKYPLTRWCLSPCPAFNL